MTMGENSAIEELKRVDHLIFVTLKYTRTVDVIRSVLERLVSTLDYQIADLLEYYRKKGKITAVPPAAMLRCRKCGEKYDEEERPMSPVEALGELFLESAGETPRNSNQMRHLAGPVWPPR